MAGSLTNAGAAWILDRVFGSVAFTIWAQHIALFTVAPGETGGGTEVSGGSYARLEIEAATGRVWTAATSADPSVIDNSADWSFAAASASWGTVVAAAIMDASSGGTMNVWGDLTTSKAVGSGDTAKFLAGAFDITLD